MEDRKRYEFRGDVLIFGNLYKSNICAQTLAKSPKAALNNIAYRVKINCGLMPSTKLKLNGDLIEIY